MSRISMDHIPIRAHAVGPGGVLGPNLLRRGISTVDQAKREIDARLTFNGVSPEIKWIDETAKDKAQEQSRPEPEAKE
jgi:hypothetical protein